jgi:flagellar FliJ protein
MFRFRLQKVLEYRSRLVDQQSVKLQEATRLWQHIQRAGERLAADIAAMTRRDHLLRQAGQSVTFWALQTGYLVGQKVKLADLRQQESEAAEEVARQREKLLAARRDKEVLEKLAMRHRQEWIREQNRRERKEMDEVGAMRAARTRQTDLPR